MHILYEEEGTLKAASILSRAPASLQVEAPHGKRSKVKSASVLLEFEHPSAGQLLEEAERFAESLDADFLWQCSGTAEFGFGDLAREYVGRDPSPVEAAGVLMKLHSAPVYFYRRGRGRFQAAPADTLKLALAAVEKKKRVQAQIEDWARALERFECPREVAELAGELLYAPDRSKPETKALERACASTGLAPVRLLERCGLVPDAHEYHLQRFLHEFFPGGTAFPPHDIPEPAVELPRGEAEAFSLDDAGTTEIDDAFSLQPREGGWRIGVHIAAPALGIAPGSALDAIARERLSTAYMPGLKYTMLPDDVVARYSLDAGTERPAISLYVDIDAEGAVKGRHSRIEQVRIAANLRHAAYEPLNAAFEEGATCGLAHEEDLRVLWRFSEALEARRGKPSAGSAVDYSFYVESGRVRIVRRPRGSPLDKLVAELMILANSTWGELLAERDVAAIYRVQTTGKVRMSVHPEPHEGLGVASYAWMSSPLRRYVDLLNQWQLVSALSGKRPPFGRTSESLLAAMRAFEVTYARYDEHQRVMEDYWCLRWLQQEAAKNATAVVLRENLVRFENIPLVTRVPSLPELAPGTRVDLQIGALDLLERTVSCAYRGTLGTAPLPQEAPETAPPA
ncbi:MAG: RNB domain-containing ribonuclease [Betaproteobacteria bacterium]|nr:RNB domain-containing ribonuclease [Betaproteobacteria bacterium]